MDEKQVTRQYLERIRDHLTNDAEQHIKDGDLSGAATTIDKARKVADVLALVDHDWPIGSVPVAAS